MLNFLRSLFASKPKPNFKELVANGAIIIDVRTPAEYGAGHIAHSLNIPLNLLAQRAQELQKKQKPIITVCRSGARSGMAKEQLIRMGLQAYNGGPWNSLLNKIA